MLSRHETHKERAQRAGKTVDIPESPRVRIRARTGEDWDDWDDQPVHRTKVLPSRVAQRGRTTEGWVIATGRGSCTVRTASGDIQVRSMPTLAIGDRVSAGPDAVERIHPRTSVLSRAVPGQPLAEQVLAANVDVVVHVVSLVSPPLRPRLIDRYLIAISRGGAEPLICVNKVDLAPGEDMSVFDVYRDLGVVVAPCSAVSGEGLAELRAHLSGKLAVFTGHSGVGKSSLLNALLPDAQLRTGEVGRKGRHTTSGSSLHALPEGGYIIDTPGIREWGLWAVSKQDLREFFPEFTAVMCRFGDCLHLGEPECGVKTAVEAGEISRRRYDAYLRILSDD